MILILTDKDLSEGSADIPLKDMLAAMDRADGVKIEGPPGHYVMRRVPHLSLILVRPPYFLLVKDGRVDPKRDISGKVWDMDCIGIVINELGGAHV